MTGTSLNNNAFKLAPPSTGGTGHLTDRPRDSPSGEASGQRRVYFTITNAVNPARPRLPPDYLHTLLDGKSAAHPNETSAECNATHPLIASISSLLSVQECESPLMRFPGFPFRPWEGVGYSGIHGNVFQQNVSKKIHKKHPMFSSSSFFCQCSFQVFFCQIRQHKSSERMSSTAKAMMLFCDKSKFSSTVFMYF